MTFGFSLCVVLLLATLVTYLEVNLGIEPPEGSEICYHQYQKSMSVLVNFQNKLI